MIDEPILKKKNKKKRLLNSQLFMIILTLLLLGGVTYAFFEFNKTSNEEIMNIAGNIYMDLSNESIGIKKQNVSNDK